MPLGIPSRPAVGVFQGYNPEKETEERENKALVQEGNKVIARQEQAPVYDDIKAQRELEVQTMVSEANQAAASPAAGLALTPEAQREQDIASEKESYAQEEQGRMLAIEEQASMIESEVRTGRQPFKIGKFGPSVPMALLDPGLAAEKALGGETPEFNVGGSVDYVAAVMTDTANNTLTGLDLILTGLEGGGILAEAAKKIPVRPDYDGFDQGLREMGQYMTLFVPGLAVTRGTLAGTGLVKSSPWAAEILAEGAASAFASWFALEGDTENLAEVIKKHAPALLDPSIGGPFLQYIQSEPGDSEASKRWKNVVEDFFLNSVISTVTKPRQALNEFMAMADGVQQSQWLRTSLGNQTGSVGWNLNPANASPLLNQELVTVLQMQRKLIADLAQVPTARKPHIQARLDEVNLRIQALQEGMSDAAQRANVAVAQADVEQHALSIQDLASKAEYQRGELKKLEDNPPPPGASSADLKKYRNKKSRHKVNAEQYEAKLAEIQAQMAAGESTLAKAAATPEQYLGGEKPQFLAQTKVVDAEGKPLGLMKGTKSVYEKDSDAFLGTGAGGDHVGPGHYFTDSGDLASEYAVAEKIDDKGFPVPEPDAAPNVRKVYLDIRNPIDMDAPLANDEQLGRLFFETGAILDPDMTVKEAYEEASRELMANEGLTIEQAKARLTAMFEEKGYDGITHMAGSSTSDVPRKVWVAFHDTQIVGAFDKSVPYGPTGKLDPTGAPFDPKKPLSRNGVPHTNASAQMLINNPKLSKSEKAKVPEMLAQQEKRVADEVAGKQAEVEGKLQGTRVIGPDGNPQVMYHATNAKFDQFSKDFMGEGEGGNLYSFGFYFSNSPEVLNKTYGKVRPDSFTDPRIAQAADLFGGKTDREIADRLEELRGELEFNRESLELLEDPNAPDPALRQRTIGQYWQMKVESAAQRLRDYEAKLAEAEAIRQGDYGDVAGTNIRPVYLNIKNPLHMDVPLRPDELARAREAGIEVTEGMTGDDLYKKIEADAPDIYQDPTTGELDEYDYYARFGKITKKMQSLGYDGINHIGGLRRGGKLHEVWIAFEPEQIVSAWDDSLKYNADGSLNWEMVTKNADEAGIQIDQLKPEATAEQIQAAADVVREIEPNLVTVAKAYAENPDDPAIMAELISQLTKLQQAQSAVSAQAPLALDTLKPTELKAVAELVSDIDHLRNTPRDLWDTTAAPEQLASPGEKPLTGKLTKGLSEGPIPSRGQAGPQPVQGDFKHGFGLEPQAQFSPLEARPIWMGHPEPEQGDLFKGFSPPEDEAAAQARMRAGETGPFSATNYGGAQEQQGLGIKVEPTHQPRVGEDKLGDEPSWSEGPGPLDQGNLFYGFERKLSPYDPVFILPTPAQALNSVGRKVSLGKKLERAVMEAYTATRFSFKTVTRNMVSTGVMLGASVTNRFVAGALSQAGLAKGSNITMRESYLLASSMFEGIGDFFRRLWEVRGGLHPGLDRGEFLTQGRIENKSLTGRTEGTYMSRAGKRMGNPGGPAISAAAFDVDPESIAGRVIDAVGYLTRGITRIQTGLDYATEALTFNSELKALAWREANHIVEPRAAGMSKAQYNAAVQEQYNRLIILPPAELEEQAKHFGSFITFSQNFEHTSASKFERFMASSIDLIEEHPYMKMILLFAKTRGRMSQAAAQYFPFLGKMMTDNETALARGGDAAAMAKAKHVTGLMVASLGTVAAMEGWILGEMPSAQDPKARSLWERFGWSPFMWVTKKDENGLPIKGVPLSGILDPFGPLLRISAQFGSIANEIWERIEDGDFDSDWAKDAEAYSMAMLRVFGKVAEDQIFFTQMMHLFSSIGRGDDNFLQRFAANLPPALVRQWAEMMDPEVRELESWYDQLMSSVPFGRGKVQTRYSLLGEQYVKGYGVFEEEAPPGLAPLINKHVNPIAVQGDFNQKYRPVYNFIATNLDLPINLKTVRSVDGVKLTAEQRAAYMAVRGGSQYTLQSGKTLEPIRDVDGLTLRERLLEIVNSDETLKNKRIAFVDAYKDFSDDTKDVMLETWKQIETDSENRWEERDAAGGF